LGARFEGTQLGILMSRDTRTRSPCKEIADTKKGLHEIVNIKEDLHEETADTKKGLHG
jgi:hypothetical protein